MSGTAKTDGMPQLTVEGKEITVRVKRGDRPATVLEAIRAQLPSQVTGAVIAGSARLHEIESYQGPTAKPKDQAAHLVRYKPDALGLKAGERPLRVVVTGYGKFIGITDNPPAKMAQALSELGVPRPT